jgi:hypothetical protein
LVLKFNLGLSCQRVGRKSTVSFIMWRSQFICSRQYII